MKKLFPVFLFYLHLNANAQEITSLSFNDFKQKEIKESAGVVVVNFWATWCKPCIEELPYFENCNNEYKNKGVKIILTNLDFNAQVKTTALPFIKKKNIQSAVMHITDTDPNSWINKVDSSWSGAIPATIIFRNGNKIFFKEGSMTQEELERVIESAIKPE
jgi:thiol-disulfide isomerase/thioredoxin